MLLLCLNFDTNNNIIALQIIKLNVCMIAFLTPSIILLHVNAVDLSHKLALSFD